MVKSARPELAWLCASFQDTAGFNCLAPGLNVMKTCDAQSGGANAVTVTATNTSTDTALTKCVATDTYNTGVDCPSTTSPVPPLTNSLALSPSGSVDLGLSGSGTETATWNASLNGLTADACNSGSVTCNIGTTSNTITVYNNATCPVNQGCETRTPGFWKTHPNITSGVMTTAGGFIQSCGLDLNNGLAGTDCSAIEDMCSLGNDAAKLGIDPTQANLIFQCAAAELNLAVTTQDGGSCGATIPNSSYTFDERCGLAGACATADPSTLYGCQAAVSAFNAQYDNTTLTSGSVLNTPGADPTACQAASGNGFVNDQSAIGAASPVSDCGGARRYLQKTTGATGNNGKHNGKP